MEIQGKIKEVLPKVEGSSEKGNYCIQPLLVEVTESFTKADGSQMAVFNEIIIELSGENAKSFNLAVGTMVKLGIRFYVREYNGKKFQKISSPYIYVV